MKGIKVVTATMEGADVKAVREAMDKLKDMLKSAALVLAAASDGKVSLIAGVTAHLTKKIKAGDLVNHFAQQVGGTEPEKLPAALASVKQWVEQKL